MEERIPKGEFKKFRVEQAIKRKKLKTVAWIAATVAVTAGLAILVAIGLSKKEKSLPGEFIEDQGRKHIAVGVDHPPYNSNPPTSGWHYDKPAEWGIYREEIPDETIVHNLEHGGIWISYKPGVSEKVIAKLESFYKKYGRKIIVTPRSANDTDIALAAWNHLDKFNVDEFSEERIDKFIKAFRNKGPEFVP